MPHDTLILSLLKQERRQFRHCMGFLSDSVTPVTAGAEALLHGPRTGSGPLETSLLGPQTLFTEAVEPRMTIAISMIAS